MFRIAEDLPDLIEDLDRRADNGSCLVAVVEDAVVGYVEMSVVDGSGHVDQVSVMPDHQRQGVGRALMQAAEQWASAQGFASMTLTTFSHVPWNRPWYEHLGYHVLDVKEIGPGLLAIHEDEIRRGMENRVVMARPL
jgi:GNAT superfamily N-acetyltransferase